MWIASVEADLHGLSEDSHTLYAKRLAIRTCYPLVKDPSGGCSNNRTSLLFQELGIMLSFIDQRAQTSGLLSGTQSECPLIFPAELPQRTRITTNKTTCISCYYTTTPPAHQPRLISPYHSRPPTKHSLIPVGLENSKSKTRVHNLQIGRAHV